MQTKKLTLDEIAKSVEKIRKRYDEYIHKFFKPVSLKTAFEDRYLRAMKSAADVSTFLLAEISAIEELIKREEDKVSGASLQSLTEKQMRFTDKVDNIIEENRKKIQKYPDPFFHKDAGEEIRHLLGAMNELEQKHWEPLVIILRDTAYSRNSLATINLESKLRYLGKVGNDRVPSGLSRYLYYLNLFPRDYQAIDREEKEYILESAFFLNELYEILVRVATNYHDLPEGSRQGLEEIMDYVLEVIKSFRLKDLKRKK